MPILTVLNGVEEVCALLGLADQCLDQQRVCLGMDVLHGDLEPVEASSFGSLNFVAESLEEVLVDNAIGGSEKCENVGDEKAFVVVEPVVPVRDIFGEIDLFSSPE